MKLSEESYSIDKVDVITNLSESLPSLNGAVREGISHHDWLQNNPYMNYLMDNMNHYQTKLIVQCNWLNAYAVYLETASGFDFHNWEWERSIEATQHIDNHRYWVEESLKSKMWGVLSWCEPGLFREHLLAKLTNIDHSHMWEAITTCEPGIREHLLEKFTNSASLFRSPLYESLDLANFKRFS